MIDINLIREKEAFVKKSCEERGYDCDIKGVVEKDKEWRFLKQEVDSLKHRRNIVTEEIRQLKTEKKSISAKLKEAEKIPEKIKVIEEKMEKLAAGINAVLYTIPNIQHSSTPKGLDSSKNKEVKQWGKPVKFSFKPKLHWEIGEKLGILDLQRAAKLSGAGFYVLKGKGARLQRALVQFMIDYHVKDGFVEINAPQIVNEKTAFGTGNLPKFENDLYKTREGLYLVPTAEVSVTNLHANETLSEKELPKYYVSFTQCYRTEAGKHGSETRGIFRLHEFEKVEMVKIVKPENSWDELESMKERAEKILEMLEIPYRTIVLCKGDAGFASAKTYDIECWAAGAEKYLEVSSCSNCADFQARRMNTKYRTAEGNKFVHTLNGSGLALPRLMISILENFQTKEGEIEVPKVLQKYTGFKKIEKSGKKEKE
jgi:seryl-tRNA synthetase